MMGRETNFCGEWEIPLFFWLSYIANYIYWPMKTQTSPQVLLQQMAQIQHMERGKLCVMSQGRGGPYYNHQTWENGKNTSRYVPGPQVGAVAQAIAGYQRFESLAEQYVELMVQKTREEMAAGFKKKTSLPSSSWPRTRKSKS